MSRRRSRSTSRGRSRSTGWAARSSPASRATTTTWWGSVSLWSANWWRSWATDGPTSGQRRGLRDRARIGVEELDLVDHARLVVDLDDADRAPEHEGAEQVEPGDQSQHQADHVGRDVV